MSGNIGPSRYRVGDQTKWVPDGRKCDECTAAATTALVTSVDVLGAEIAHLCPYCYGLTVSPENKERRQRPMRCDLCDQNSATCEPWRDPEQGMTGPMLHVCEECRVQRNEDALALFGEEDPLEESNDITDDFYIEPLTEQEED